jgi:hypothetical protein
VAATLVGPQARAQDVDADALRAADEQLEPLDSEAADPLDAASEPVVPPADEDSLSGLVAEDAYADAGGYFDDSATYYAGPSATQPVNWISGPYIKAGVPLALGEDLLENNDAGYAISGGFRQPWGPAFDQRLFWDLGGSYLSAFGETTRATAGLVTTRLGSIVISRETDPDLFTSTLKEIRRGSVHAAMGWYWGDVMDDRTGDPQLRLGTRLGGRIGHVRGRFGEDVPSEDPDSNETFEIIPYGETDTFPGLFFAVEAIVLDRDTRWGSCQWVLDVEFANDWVNFSGFERGSLPTASIMGGFMLSR